MIYITGDMHGDSARFDDRALKKLKKHDTLFVCGDFGFIWNGSEAEQKLLKKLGKKKYTIAFLDGRHENYDLLGDYPCAEWKGGKVQVISGNLIHLLRGEIYKVEGKTFFAFGGGESPDHDIRAGAGTFFEAQTPTPAQLKNAEENLAKHENRVDYILTHEPSGKANGFFSVDTPSNGINLLFNRFEEAISFTRWYFGCLHIDRHISARHRAVFQHILPVEELWQVRKGKHFKKA